MIPEPPQKTFSEQATEFYYELKYFLSWQTRRLFETAICIWSWPGLRYLVGGKWERWILDMPYGYPVWFPVREFTEVTGKRPHLGILRVAKEGN
jgi:hypothetical protein